MTRKKELTEKIDFRVSSFEKNRIKWLAKKYAKGNLSLYILWAAMNAPRKDISPEMVLEYSKRRKKGD